MGRAVARYLVAGLTALAVLPAQAEIARDGLLKDVTQQFLEAAEKWGPIMTGYATWLFWVLVSISMAFTFGMMVLRKADIGEVFTELLRFGLTTGFFWWLLDNGPTFATAIIDSMRKIGAMAGGLKI